MADLRRSLFAATLAFSTLSAACPSFAQTDPLVTDAAARPNRAADLDLDNSRKGPKIAQFIGLREGDHVVDLIPSGGYWTRLFANIVGPKGRVDGIWPNSYAQADHKNISAYMAMGQSGDFGRVRTYIEPARVILLDEPVDVFFTSMNYHDYSDSFVGPVSPDVFNRQVFNALKPGGLYIVIDHVGAPCTGMRQIGTLHRIEPQVVRQQIEAAGFVFVADSDLLRNPADDHSLSVFDEAIRGKTDRFIYKFRKPT